MTQTAIEAQLKNPDDVFDLDDDVFELAKTEAVPAAELTPEQVELSTADDVFDLDPETAEAVIPEKTIPSPQTAILETPDVDNASPTQKQEVAQLKLFGNGSGAMLFGDAAIAVAESLKIETKLATNGAPSLKLIANQFEAVTAVLQDHGWRVETVEPKVPARILIHGSSATVYGEGVKEVAEELGLPVGLTETGNPKVKIDRDQVDQVSALLKKAGYAIQSSESVNRTPIKILFREHPDGATISVFDASAKNVARAMGTEPDHTPGGRAVIYFTPEEYKEVKVYLKEKGFAVSLQDLELKAKISTFVKDDGGIGAVLVGAPALEAAGTLGLETGYTKPCGSGNTSMPKLVVSGAEQIDAVKSALEAQEYLVEMVELPALKIANERILPTGSAAYFGEPAKLAAEFLGVKPEATRQGNAMVEVKQDEIAATRGMLKEQGYEIRSEVYTPPVQKEKVAAPPKPKTHEGGR